MDRPERRTLLAFPVLPADCCFVAEPERVSEIIPRALSDMLKLRDWSEHIIDGHLEAASDSDFDNTITPLPVDYLGYVPLGAASGDRDLFRGPVAELLLALPPRKCHPALIEKSDVTLMDLTYTSNLDCQGFSFRRNVPRGNMRLIEAYAERAKWAFWRLQHPSPVTQSELGVRVGKRVKRTFTQTAVAGWLSRSLPRDLETQVALALELGVTASWLYFKEGIAPAGWVEPERKASKAPEIHVPDTRTSKKRVQAGS